jgi:hypothetical protein
VTLTDLAQHFGSNRPITPDQWAYAVLLGRARTISNKDRAPGSDRDADGNEEVDLHGALGELVLRGIVRRLPGFEQAARYMENHMFRKGGGSDVKGPDLLFADHGTDVGIDVKTFDCREYKRYFAINDNKHHELQGQCVGYMGLICPPYAHTACITRLIPYDAVSTWDVRQLRKDKNGKRRGTPSRNLEIDVVMRQYTASAYDIAKSRSEVYPEAVVFGLARQKGEGSVIARLSQVLPAAAPYLAEAQATLDEDALI